jgi:hypothetical protein
MIVLGIVPLKVPLKVSLYHCFILMRKPSRIYRAGLYGTEQGGHWGVKDLLDSWKKNWVEY